MMNKGVTGAHHKQPQTVAGWFAVHERGDVKDILDDMVADRDVPVRRKGRGTVQLTSIEGAKAYLREHGEDPSPGNW